jgi:hypothetical protein
MTQRRLPAFLLAVALVAACTSGKKPQAIQTPTPSVSATPSPTPSPSPTKKPLVSPFTGLPVDKLRPVIAVKVDNAVLARPQWGLDGADIVYEEAVEGRTTRFFAIFSSKSVAQIGPVRSVRENDVPLLRMFGKIAFAFSGGNKGVLGGVRASGAAYEVSYNNTPSAYTIAGRRRDAFNFVTGSDRILAHAPNAAVARDIGLRFGAKPAGGKAGRQMSFTWSRYARTSWVYNATKKRYLRYMDGRAAMLRSGAQESAADVLVQYCTVRNSRYSDVHGTPSPYTTTTGTGKAVLLRDGKAYYGTWKRNGLGQTHFVDAKGKDLRLKAGQVWVMLAPSDLRATIS